MPSIRDLIPTIFKAVALATGVAVIVLNILGTLTVTTAVTLLGVGLTALAIVALQKIPFPTPPRATSSYSHRNPPSGPGSPFGRGGLW